MAVEMDPVWKEALDAYLAGFLEYLCPATHALGDWSVPPEALDAELQKLLREAEVGKVLADRLYRVKRKDGPGDLFLLIHVEVQNDRDHHFARRMWEYHYRIYDAHGQHPVALALLGDTAPDWRPAAYEFQAGDTRLTYAFASVKLWDWRDRIDELEAMPNPFAMVVLAHLQCQLNRKDEARRFEWKRRLARLLYDKGYHSDDFRRLFKVIDSLLQLPAELDRRIVLEMSSWDKEKNMPLISPFEIRVKEEGRQEGLQEGRQKGRQELLSDLAAEMATDKFGEAGRRFAETDLAAADAATLKKVVKAVSAAVTLDDLRALLADPSE